jgi:hypothetical protein
MASFPFEVIQQFCVTRKINITVDGDSLDDALEQLESGSVDIPSFDDPNWKSSWQLENEGYSQPEERGRPTAGLKPLPTLRRQRR